MTAPNSAGKKDNLKAGRLVHLMVVKMAETKEPTKLKAYYLDFH